MPRAELGSPVLRRRLLRASTAVLATLLGFGALEIGLRIHHHRAGTYETSDELLEARRESPWMRSDDPDLVYVHRPGNSADDAIRIEAHGVLRRRALRTPKPAGVRRVAVVGDSVGAAMYLGAAPRFPILLERRLSARLDAPVQVLNLCVDGYDTRQEARLLETVATKLEPDSAVLVYCLNDPAQSLTPLQWFRGPEPPTSYALDFVLSRLGVGDGRLLAPGTGPTGEGRSHWERMYDPDGEGWRGVLEGLDRIAAWQDEQEIPVLVAVAPLLLADDPRGESTAEFREQVTEALDERGLAHIDLQSAVSSAGLPVLAENPIDIYHFSAAGHEALAEALYPHVEALLLDEIADDAR